MKLSMWMIANRLGKYNISTDVLNKNAPIYQSVRLIPRMNCVHVCQKDENVECVGDGDVITFKSNTSDNVFDIIADIFDDYNNLENDAIKYAESYDLEGLINRLFDFFNNPIVLFDKNYNVLALTKQYGIDDVNSEWRHYYTYGSPSLDHIIQNKDSSAEFISDPSAQIYRFNSPSKQNYMTCSIAYNNVEIGRIAILEKDRTINFGDQQLLNCLILKIAPILTRTDFSKKEFLGQNYLLKILMDVAVDDTELKHFFKYSTWNQEDSLKICLITPHINSIINEYLSLIKEYSLKLLPDFHVFIHQEQIIMVMNESIMSFETAIKLLKSVTTLEKNSTISISLTFKGLKNLRKYWNQAIFAANYGKLLNNDSNYYNFFDYAIDYIIQSKNNEDIYYACHPDIIKMHQDDNKNQTNMIETISTYLTNERSLIRTANALFVHRSTLIYRIKKIINRLEYDIEDSYSREYMMLSVRILNLLKYDILA